MLCLGLTIAALFFQTTTSYPQFGLGNGPSNEQNLQQTIDSIFTNPNKNKNVLPNNNGFNNQDNSGFNNQDNTGFNNQNNGFNNQNNGFNNQNNGFNNQNGFNSQNNNQQSSNNQNNNQQQFSPTTPGTTTTVLPIRLRNCIQECPVTSQYSPVCGSNGQTYNNMSAFQCAVGCGVNISLTRQGPCARRGK